jgi:hypothetical protein
MQETAIPARLPAYKGESILGYLKRLAAATGGTNVTELVPGAADAENLWTLPTTDGRVLSKALGKAWDVLQRSHIKSEDLGVKMNGVSMASRLLRLSGFWFCPECLGEQPFHRNAWYFAPLSACHIHGRMLLDRCSACDSPIAWNSPGVDTCHSCSKKLSGSRGAEVENRYKAAMAALYAIADGGAAQDFSILGELSGEDRLELLRILGKLATNVDGHEYQKETTERASSQADLMTRGHALVENWPVRFHEYLDKLSDKNSHVTTRSYRCLEPIHAYIDLRPDEGWRYVLNRAFKDYLDNKGLKPTRRMKR